MTPSTATLVAMLILLASRFLSYGADVVQMGGPVYDWVGWVEKAGTVGVCVWMLVWFQRRNDRQHDQLSTIAERSVIALERNNESNKAFTTAVEAMCATQRNMTDLMAEWKEVVHQCRKNGGN